MKRVEWNGGCCFVKETVSKGGVEERRTVLLVQLLLLWLL